MGARRDAAARRAPRRRAVDHLGYAIVLGRIIGFTKGYEVPVPDDIDFDFG